MTRLAVAVNMHGQALALNLGLIIPMHRIRWPNGKMSDRVLATFTLKARWEKASSPVSLNIVPEKSEKDLSFVCFETWLSCQKLQV